MAIDPITGGIDPEGKEDKPLTEGLTTPPTPKYQVGANGRLYDMGANTVEMSLERGGEQIELPNIASLSDDERKQLRKDLLEMGVEPKGIDILIQKQQERDDAALAAVASRPAATTVTGTAEEPADPFHDRARRHGLEFLTEDWHQNMEAKTLSERQLEVISILRNHHESKMLADPEYARMVDQQYAATDGLISASQLMEFQAQLAAADLDPNGLEMLQAIRYAAFGANERFWEDAENHQERSAGLAGLRETVWSIGNTFANVLPGLMEESGSQEQIDELMIAQSFNMQAQMLDPRRRRSMILDDDDDVQEGSFLGAAAYTMGSVAPDIVMVATGAGTAGTIAKGVAGRAAAKQAASITAKAALKNGSKRVLLAKAGAPLGGMITGATRTTGESTMTQFGEHGYADNTALYTGLAKSSLEALPVLKQFRNVRGKGALAGASFEVNRAANRHARAAAQRMGRTVQDTYGDEVRRSLSKRVASALVLDPAMEGATETAQSYMDAFMFAEEHGIDWFFGTDAQNTFLSGMVGMQPFSAFTNTVGFHADVAKIRKQLDKVKTSGSIATAVATAASGKAGQGEGFHRPGQTEGTKQEGGVPEAVAAGKVRLIESGAQPAAIFTQEQLDTLSEDQTEGKDLIPVNGGFVMFDPSVVKKEAIIASMDNGTFGAFVGNLVTAGDTQGVDPSGGVGIVDADGNLISVMAFDASDGGNADVVDVQGYQNRRAALAGEMGTVLLDGEQVANYLAGETVIAPPLQEDFFDTAVGQTGPTAPIIQDENGFRVTLGAGSLQQQASSVVAQLSNANPDADISEVAEGDLTDSQRGMVEKAKRAGKKVVFVQGTEKGTGKAVKLTHEGAMRDGAPDVIVLDSAKPDAGHFVDTILHELDHHMARDNPELHNALMGYIARAGYGGQWITRDQEQGLRETLVALYKDSNSPEDIAQAEELADAMIEDAKKNGAEVVSGNLEENIQRLEAEGKTEQAAEVREALDSMRKEQTADTSVMFARRTGMYSVFNPDASMPRRITDFFRRRLASYGLLGRTAQIYLGAMEAQMEGLPWGTMYVGTKDAGKEVRSPVPSQEARDVAKEVGTEGVVTPLEELNLSVADRESGVSDIDQMIEEINEMTPFSQKTVGQMQILKDQKRHHGKRSSGDTQADIRFSRGVNNGTNEGLRQAAAEYNESKGLPPIKTDVLDVDPALHSRMADFLEDVEHAPNDPEVVRAYDALKTEIMDQFDVLVNAGHTFIAHSQEGMEPYQPSAKTDPDQRSPSKKMRDQVEQEKTLVFFPTIQPGQEVFGQTTDQAFDHPLLERTGIMVETNGGGQYELTFNDVFRVVHDVFGHAKEGSSFGMIGEENAVVQHAQMFSDTALPALIAETRMQNAFMHFGRHLRRPDGSIPKPGDQDFVPVEERPFADQKVFIPPAEAMQINLPVEDGDSPATNNGLRASAAVVTKRKQIARDVLGSNLSYLTEDEIASIGTRRLAENIDLNVRSFPSQGLLEKAAEMGKPMMKWYQAANLTITKAAESMGMEPWRLAGLLAATSPSKSVEASVKVAFGLIKDAQAAGGQLSEEQIRESIKRHSGLEADMGNAIRVMQATTEQEMYDALSGLKVTAFAKALQGNLNEVVGDTLMARAYGIYNQRMSNKAEFLASTIVIRKLAQRMGITPAEAQAAIWVVSRTTSGRVSASRVQQAKALAEGKKPTRGVSDITDTPIEPSEVFRGDDIANLLAGRSRKMSTGEVRSLADILQEVGVDTASVDSALTAWESQNPEATPEGWESRSLADAMGLRAGRRFVRNIDNSFKVAEKDPSKAVDLRASLAIDRTDSGPFKTGGEQAGTFIKLDMFGPEARAFVEESSVDLTDADGDPLVMFHGGTLENGERIVSSAFGAAGPGSYMASNRGVAQTYAPEKGSKKADGGVFPLIVAPTGLVLQQDISSLIAHEETFGQDLRNWPSMSDIANVTKMMDTEVANDLDGSPLGLNVLGLNGATATQEQSRKGKGGSFGGTHHPINDLLNPNTKTPLLKLNYENAPLGKPLPMHTYVGKDGSVYQLIGFQIDGNIADKNSKMIGHFVKAEGKFVEIGYAGVASMVDDPGNVSTSFGRSSMFMNDSPTVQVTFDAKSNVVASSDTSAFPVGQEINHHAKGNQLGGSFTGITNIGVIRTQFNNNVGRQIGQLRNGASHVLKSDKPMLVSMRGVEVPLAGTFRLPLAHKQHLGISGTFMQFGGLSLNLAEVGSARSAIPGEATFGTAEVEHSKRSESGMVSAYNIRASIRGVQGSQEFENDLSTRTQRALVDKFVDLEDVSKELARRGALREDRDAYTAIRLQNARVSSQTNEYVDGTLQPMAELMAENDVEMHELEEYAYALHAKERNAVIAQRNPDMPDGGSGMTNLEADEIINKYMGDPRRMAFQELAGMLTNIQFENLQMLHDAGLITFDEMVTMQSTYQHYMPLEGISDPIADQYEQDLSEVMPSPRGRLVGSSSGLRRAEGRTSRAPNPLLHALSRRGNVLARIEKNRTANRLLRAALALDEPGMLEVHGDLPMTKVNGKNQADTAFAKRPDVVTVHLEQDTKVGEKTYKAGEKVYVQVRNAPLAGVLNRSMDEGGGVGEAMIYVGNLFNNVMRFTITTFAPEFMLRNLFRDVQTGVLNQAAERGFSRAGKTAGLIGRALRTTIMAEFGGEGPLAKEYAEMTEGGGRQSGYARLDLDAVADSMRELQRTVRKGGKSSRSKWRKAMGWIIDLGTGIENASRLSTYVAEREAGVSAEQAALRARDVTVDFSRKGTWGAGLNAMYLFFNAGAQGANRLYQAAKGKRGKQVMAGVTGMGMLASYWNAAFDEEDDETGLMGYDLIPEWEKRSHAIFAIPGSGGDYLKIPLPYGFHLLYNMGTSTTEVLDGRLEIGEAFNRVTMTALDTFNPLAGSGVTANPTSGLAPTAVKPLVDISTNRNFAGNRIYAEQAFGYQGPDSQQGFPTTPEGYKDFAEFMNMISGGDAYEPGALDFQPEIYRHFYSTFTGDIGRTLGRTKRLIDSIRDEEVNEILGTSREDVPFLRTITGTVTERNRDMVYRDLVSDTQKVYFAYQEAIEAGDEAKVQEIETRDPAYLELAIAMHQSGGAVSQQREYKQVLKFIRSLGDEALFNGKPVDERDMVRVIREHRNDYLKQFAVYLKEKRADK